MMLLKIRMNLERWSLNLEIPVALSTSYRSSVSIPFREGLSTLFRDLNILLSSFNIIALNTRAYSSIIIGEGCSITPEYAVPARPATERGLGGEPLRSMTVPGLREVGLLH